VTPDQAARQVRVETPAKVNLLLGVGPVRADGFHELATLFYALDLTDTLDAALVREPGDGSRAPVSLTVRSERPRHERLHTDERNLAVAACLLVQRTYDVRQGIHLTLDKQIPVSGGLAGGSADAAAALVAADALWGLGLAPAELAALGARLGSDVPFALAGGAAVGHGRGERLTPVSAGAKLAFVLVCADQGLSTPAVYREFDRMRADGSAAPGAHEVPATLLAALAEGDVAGIAATVHNDLQQAAVALRPELGETLRQGLDAGARASLVSGSGPTCVLLADDREHAETLRAALSGRDRHGSAVIAVGGPSPGARITGSDG
jgi:4-diphosphocytidyl-2-C-methyl-D-erythritol kinase